MARAHKNGALTHDLQQHGVESTSYLHKQPESQVQVMLAERKIAVSTDNLEEKE
jgi:hypothetical protein